MRDSLRAHVLAHAQREEALARGIKKDPERFSMSALISESSCSVTVVRLWFIDHQS